MAKSAKRKVRKNVVKAIVHIKATFNNTLITVTDPDGNVICSGSAGCVGFKGTRKSTPFAAQQAAQTYQTPAVRGLPPGLGGPPRALPVPRAPGRAEDRQAPHDPLHQAPAPAHQAPRAEEAPEAGTQAVTPDDGFGESQARPPRGKRGVPAHSAAWAIGETCCCDSTHRSA